MSDFRIDQLRERMREIAFRIDHEIQRDMFTRKIEPDYLRDAVRAYPLNTGKCLRPALMWFCAELLNVPREKILHAAVAAELYHNWTLIHDDLIDSDVTRRGQPTVHAAAEKQFIEAGLSPERARAMGISTAVLAGDLLHAWSADRLTRMTQSGVDPEIVVFLSHAMHGMLSRDLISGEALDVDFSIRPLEEIERSLIARMNVGKTGALLRFSVMCPIAVARHATDTTHYDFQRLFAFADALGSAFQLRDDELGIFGLQKTLGKPIGADLTERKCTFMLISALEALPPEKRAELLALTGRLLSEDELNTARRLISESGARQKNTQRIEQYAGMASTILWCYPPSPARDMLTALCSFVARRDS